MKPLFLELQAFGPFAGSESVDFEKLSRSGIFLIKGKTGSGKTTIFDAMSFALYGKSTGEEESMKSGRNDLEQWRCNQADARTPTVVSFTFEANGRKYNFARRLEPRKKADGFNKKYAGGELDSEGTIIPFFDNPKEKDLNGKAEELIGLSHEQFCQVALLPQGKFEKFLTADSGEKEDILRKIFRTANWGAYAKHFYDAAKARLQELEDEKKQLDLSLQEENLHSVAELSEAIESKKNEREELRKEQERFGGEARQQQLNSDRTLSGEFAILHNLEKAEKTLVSRESEMKEKQERYNAALKAEALRTPIKDAEEAAKSVTARENELNGYRKRLPDTESRQESAASAVSAQKSNSPVEKLNADIGVLQSKKGTYEQIDGLKAEWDTAEKECGKAKTAHEKAEQDLEAAKYIAQKKYKAYNDAEAEAKNLRDHYYAGIYGEIASNLTDGSPCPVCGSTHHPMPAEKIPDSVSKEKVDEGERLADAARKAWEAAERQRQEAESKANTEKGSYSVADRKRNAAQAAYDYAKSSLIDGIPDTVALKAKIKELEKKIHAYNDRLAELEKAEKDASEALAALKANIIKAENELEAAQKTACKAAEELAAVLAAHGFASAEEVKPLLLDPAEREQMHEELVEYGTDCRTNRDNLTGKRQELEGKTEPDSTQFEARQKEITDKSAAFAADVKSLSDAVDRLSKKLKKLSENDRHYNAEINQAQDDCSFARSLVGSSGEGLERYVLGIMFEQVLSEANRMLDHVHGGRYRLERSEEAEGSSHKSGLDLLAHDNRSPEMEGRSVHLLSGGEKFLVSLALSIGLSHFAQRSGVRIEALFIDEGFGTLDESSISDAMAILETVRGKSGMIGIISHVALLEATIGTHLEVVKTDAGSSIRPV